MIGFKKGFLSANNKEKQKSEALSTIPDTQAQPPSKPPLVFKIDFTLIND